MLGKKDNLDLFHHLIKRNIPDNITIYIEPFGGSFGLCKLIEKKIKSKKVYNDLYDYDYQIDADEIYHLDYKIIIDKFNNENSFFYIDPPYIGKEHYYNIKFSEHFELSEKIKEIKGKWMLSYQEHPLLREWYKDYFFDKYDGKSTYHSNEIIIKNY
jgi:DNA adenine methylase